jgi:hypothetical protein
MIARSVELTQPSAMIDPALWCTARPLSEKHSNFHR